MFKLAETALAQRNLYRDEEGATAVLVALALAVIMGFVGLVMDGGMLYETHRQLQNGVDGAALAGAWELMDSQGTAQTAALDYADRNRILGDVTSVSFSTVLGVNPAITVSASRAVTMTFARALGINSINVGASSTAIVAQAQPEDLWPWGVPKSVMADAGIGKTITLKTGSPPGPPGNFGPLDFPPKGGGASDYQSAILYGWDGDIGSIPWTINTETGNMVEKTKAAVDDLIAWSNDPIKEIGQDCSPTSSNPDFACWRIGLVPILEDDPAKPNSWANCNGACSVDVVGFAVFYMDGMTGEHGGHMEVQGEFLKTAMISGGKTKPGAPLEGLIGVRLWR